MSAMTWRNRRLSVILPFLLSISIRLPPDFPCKEEKTLVTRYRDSMSGGIVYCRYSDGYDCDCTLWERKIDYQVHRIDIHLAPLISHK
jgi:hypothetical protein